jgi:hypothetical protein
MRHGTVDISVQENMVILRPVGAFNMDSVRYYEKAFNTELKALKGKKWALLNTYKDFETCGPDVTAHIRNQLLWCQAHGCEVIGFVTFNSLQDYFVKEVTKGIPFRHIEIFNNQEEAQNRLRQVL